MTGLLLRFARRRDAGAEQSASVFLRPRVGVARANKNSRAQLPSRFHLRQRAAKFLTTRIHHAAYLKGRGAS
ncbi:MAG TPA: hypothetical protein VG105_03905, partial [Paraburkholderia sp.]|nr:hypothetical protein [Paraburkholderia sp.]